jgi:hypothetical protein
MLRLFSSGRHLYLQPFAKNPQPVFVPSPISAFFVSSPLTVQRPSVYCSSKSSEMKPFFAFSSISVSILPCSFSICPSYSVGIFLAE